MKCRIILTFSLILILTACAVQAAPQPTLTPFTFTSTPRSVIIDTDMAADDWMAILYLLRRPDVIIKAITITGVGEAHCEPGVEHALGLAALAGQPDIPVSCGRESPLQGTHTFPAEWRISVDSLTGLTLPDNSASSSPQPAVELLKTTIESSPDKMTILTLGPLTNLAEALQTTPNLKDNIEMVYIMGGAVDVSGNMGRENQVAEWNIYVDPYTAALVFQAGVSITLIPLDATNHVPVTTSFFKRLKSEHNTPEASFVFDVLTKNYGFIQSGGFYFWDPLAAGILTDNSLATFETKTLTIIEEEGPESGRTKESESGMSMRVAVNADSQQFESLFLGALNATQQ